MPMCRLLQMWMLSGQLFDHFFQVLPLLALVLQHFRPFVALILRSLQVLATGLHIITTHENMNKTGVVNPTLTQSKPEPSNSPWPLRSMKCETMWPVHRPICRDPRSNPHRLRTRSEPDAKRHCACQSARNMSSDSPTWQTAPEWRYSSLRWAPTMRSSRPPLRRSPSHG